jgi:hypothetical protein
LARKSEPPEKGDIGKENKGGRKTQKAEKMI